MFNSLPFLLCKYRSIATYWYACSLILFFIVFFFRSVQSILTMLQQTLFFITLSYVYYVLSGPRCPQRFALVTGRTQRETERDRERGRECGREVVETKHNRVTKLLKTDINLIKCDGCSTWTKPPPSFNQSFVSLPATKWDIKHEISEIEDMRYSIRIYVYVYE